MPTMHYILYIFFKDTMIKASQLLYKATDYRFYFKTINVLLPREWNTIPGFTPSATAM